MAGVSVTFGGKDAGLAAAQRKQAQDAAKVDQAYKSQAKSAKEAERQQREGHRAIQRDLQSTLASYASIQAAIAAINNEYRNWVQNERERANLARTGIEAARNLALLQEPGQIDQAIRRTARLGQEFGVFRTEEERRALFDLVQSFQSAQGGNFERGLQAARGALGARFAGIEFPTARELILQGIAQGEVDPTSFVRRGLAAGQLSFRTAEEISRNAAELRLFEDKDFGFSAAAILTDVFKEESRTFVKAAARALQTEVDVSELGLTPDATDQQILGAIRARGITTLRQMEAIGVGNIRGQQALQVLSDRLPELLQEAAVIRQRNVPGFIAQRVAELEAESPMFATQRAQARLESQFQVERFPDVEALMQENRRRARGILARRRGIESVAGIDIADETGRVTPLGSALLELTEPRFSIQDAIRGAFQEFFVDVSEDQLTELRKLNALLENDPNAPAPIPATPGQPED